MVTNEVNDPNDRVATLADGHEIPRLGLGVWQVPDGPECVQAVRIFDFALSDEDMDELDGLDRTGGTAKALERQWW